MKKTTRFLSLVLTLMMVFSCIGMEAFAATAETVKQYGANPDGGYLAIGDSICRGCGTAGYPHPYYDYAQRNVEGAFPYIIAQAVGCSTPDDITDQTGNYWPLCYPGMTLGVTMDLFGIEDDFSDTAFDYSNYDHMMEKFGHEGSAVGVRGETYTTPATVGSVLDLAQKASLITVELGMCDVFYRALRIAESGGFLADGIELDLSDPSALLSFAKTYLSEMNNGFQYWKTWYPKLIERLKELNPEATIVMVGSFNIAGGLRITDDMVVPVGNAVSAITASMNLLYKQWAKQYGVIYADISNTETLAAENEWSLLGDFLANAEIASHPAPAGNAYIARQILSVLPDAEGETKTPKGLNVDLGRFTKVDKVLINGVPVLNYEMDGTVLKVPCYDPLAVSLIIVSKDDNGDTAVQSYQLAFKNGSFDAYRVYATNNLKATVFKPVKNVFNITKSVLSGFAGLFNKD